jgi:C-terminal processing protease CtpA/Prc
MLLASCAPRTGAVPTAKEGTEPYQITGSYKVTNDFVLATYYVENAVTLTDMHGFVTRDLAWELPVASQALGYMTFDKKSLSGTYELSLPEVPLGEFNDVNHDAVKDKGVQVFAVAYSPNTSGGPFQEGDDPARGWPTYLASVKTDAENKDEVTGGKLVVWAPDANQQFPTGFGSDGLLFTADDPVGPIPAGYSIVDLDQTPFAVTQEPKPELTLYEPKDIAVKDYSAMSYTEAFDKMFEVIRKEYAFADQKGKAPDWDALYATLKPPVAQAEKDKDPNAFYLVLRDFTRAFKDGHVSMEGGKYAQQDFADATSGGYGFAIRELDDGKAFVIFVMDGGPAQKAKIEVGAEVTAFNDKPISEAIDGAQSFSNQSSDFAIRYQKVRYLLSAAPGTKSTVTFINPGSSTPQTVTLEAVEERQSFSRTSLYFGVNTNSLLPVDSSIIPSGNSAVGYVRINSNYDDLNLVVRLFERALQKFQEAKVPGIVIDMRYNSGGSPLSLAGFLTDKEIPMGQLEYYSDKTGKFEPEGLRDKVYPSVDQYHFDKMVLLVGPACFSACEIESYGFSQVPGMIVVGQYPTAGVEAETARGSFKLPGDFGVTVPTGRFTLPDGSIFLEGKGVPPTLRVPIDEKTALATDDIVLKAGIDAVLKPAGAGVAPGAPPKVASASEAEAALTSGVAFLEDLAREKHPAGDFAQPGVVTYTVPLPKSEPVIWSYAWCAADADKLAANLKNIQLKFTLDGEEVPTDSFGTFETETGGKTCHLTYTSLSDWSAGEHHLVTTATFTAKVNDGTQEYEPGDYVLEYQVISEK